MGEPKKKPGRSRKNGTDWELRRYVMLLAAVIVLILIGAVAMFSGKITNILGKKDGLPAEMVDTGGSGMVIEPDTKEYIQDFGGCILTENGEPGITELMNTYFQAVSDCDMDTFVKLFTSQDTSEEEHYRQEFEEQKQYISGYQNVKCYTTPGLRDGEMAAYVYYEILYTGVETPAPSLVRIYAVRAEDGSWQRTRRCVRVSGGRLRRECRFWRNVVDFYIYTVLLKEAMENTGKWLAFIHLTLTGRTACAGLAMCVC